MDSWVNMPNAPTVRPIRPNSNIVLCKNIPWDRNYKHVRDFTSENALLNFLNSRAYSSYSNCVPIKIGSGFEVQIPVAEVVANQINYMYFRNTSYSDQYYYAFVTGTEYVSDNSSILKYEIDDFQNAWYNTNVNSCFVVREHVALKDDIKTGNLVNDNVPLGEYMTYGYSTQNFGDMYVCLVTSQNSESQPVDGAFFNNVYSGLAINTINVNAGIGSINSALEPFRAMPDSVASLFMAPSMCVNNETADISVSGSSLYGSYTPKNKKCYTYPYCYIVADDHTGNAPIFKFENANADDSLGITFRSTGVLNTTPAVYTRPINYGGVGTDDSSGFVTSAFPICAWSTDYYQAWLAQNKSSMALTAIAQGGTTIAGALTGNIAGAVAGATGLANTLARDQDRQAVPDQVRGKVLAENVNTAIGLNSIRYYVKGLKPSVIRRIDSYWSTYGYPTYETKIPNIRSRSTWNYVETKDCAFTVNADTDATDRLRAIFDNGVTLWHTNDIGNYLLSNN